MDQSESGTSEDENEIKDFLTRAEVHVEPGITWEDVVGIKAASEKIKEFLVLPVKFPKLFEGTNRPSCVGLLIYGPPGSGRTLLVQATINELFTTCSNFLCYKLSAYDLLSRWLKNPLRIFKTMMETAKNQEHSVVFIDDVDALCESTELCLNLKKEMDTQLHSANPKTSKSFCLVGLSNKPWKIAEDKLLLQIFDIRIPTPLPNNVERCAIFKKQLDSAQHSLQEEDIRKFGEMSVGMTGADICSVARDSLLQPVRKVQAATHFKQVCGPSGEGPNKTRDDLLTPCDQDDPGAIQMDWTRISDPNMLASPVVTMDDVMKSLSAQKPSVRQEELAMYELPM
ncbi:vacuolar protein sorting-associated protein 4A-like [Ruditapes philippinarum]|uniref:vacuolar protein sorting-associated protein 4A-like n=1 Tax=Ruditapes philippinarum TaxID=129788 RepID=UPI00295B26C0|nr:vacuolar protein sorting-associated protein 4A-like [Ruditapes philippinarum]